MINGAIDVMMGRMSEAAAPLNPGAREHAPKDFADSLSAAQQVDSGVTDPPHTVEAGVTLGAFLGMRGSYTALPIAIGDPDWAEALPPQGRQFVDEIEDAAREAGIDPALLAAVVWAESEFVPTAESPAGALGLTQLMPATAEILGVDPLDAADNLRGGARFLADMIARYDGDVILALAAYNSGSVTVDNAGGAPSFTHAYIDRVLEHLESMGGGSLDGAGSSGPDSSVVIDLHDLDATAVTLPAPAPLAATAGGSGPAPQVPGSAIADRIMAAVEQLRNQPPPQRMVIEIPELDGARITVALRNGTVVLSPRGLAQEAMAAWLPAVEEALERHGLDTRRDSRDRRSDGDHESDQVAARRRRVIMEGAQE